MTDRERSRLAGDAFHGHHAKPNEALYKRPLGSRNGNINRNHVHQSQLADACAWWLIRYHVWNLRTGDAQGWQLGPGAVLSSDQLAHL